MSRNARTPASRSRRIALGFGTAAGAAVIAASLSMGTAPVAGADVSDADVVSSLVGALDPNAFSAASVPDTVAGVPDAAESVPEANAISYLIDALDPDQFTSTGAPAGVFGTVGYYLDTYLFGPNGDFPTVDALLDPYVEELVSSLPSGAASAATVGDADPVSDLIGALDPSAFNALGAPDDALGLLASGLDADLLASLGLGTPLDSVIDGLVGSSTLF
jgi:hypothetical protein